MIYNYVTINMKMVTNVQKDFEQTLANKLLLCGHLEKKVIKIQYVTSSMIDLFEYQFILTSLSRWTRSNHFYTSVCSKFICTLSTIFVFMVIYYIYIYI